MRINTQSISFRLIFMQLAALLVPLVMCVASVEAKDISGKISKTLTITSDSRLVGDVTCTTGVQTAPCIVIGANDVELNLNGFSITGPVNPLTNVASCSFPTDSAFGVGIFVNGQTDVKIEGPGVIQNFQRWGILLLSSSDVAVRRVTATQNCWSGLQLAGVTDFAPMRTRQRQLILDMTLHSFFFKARLLMLASALVYVFLAFLTVAYLGCEVLYSGRSLRDRAVEAAAAGSLLAQPRLVKRRCRKLAPVCAGLLIQLIARIPPETAT